MRNFYKTLAVLLLALGSLFHIQAQQSSTYGNFFTPQGKLKVLVIYSGDDLGSDDVRRWPNGIDGSDFTTLPLWADSLFYTDFNQFSDTVTADTDILNVSNYFYQMSAGKLQVIGEAFPIRTSHSTNPRLAIDQARALYLDTSFSSNYPTFNLATFDNRVGPNRFDPDVSPDLNLISDDTVDNNIDFALVVFRSTSSNGGVYSNTDNNYAIGGGFAIQNHFFVNSSHSRNTNLILHEMAHSTDRTPHANTINNGVLGMHFYNDHMWGEMNGNGVFSCANGWERWRRGWMNNVYSVEGTEDSIDITLGDFITKGEAVKIRIPGKWSYAF